jgi:pimeloyl-ACP methyl ester carboxylesterase
LGDRAALARYVWKRLYNPKLRARLRRIKIPALVLCGEEDELLPQDYGRALATSIPSARLVSIAGFGHALPLEQNGILVDTVTSFLNENAGG